jgi:hypothetical protein
MSVSAIAMMIVGMVIIWGGLVVSILNAVYKGKKNN